MCLEAVDRQEGGGRLVAGRLLTLGTILLADLTLDLADVSLRKRDALQEMQESGQDLAVFVVHLFSLAVPITSINLLVKQKHKQVVDLRLAFQQLLAQWELFEDLAEIMVVLFGTESPQHDLRFSAQLNLVEVPREQDALIGVIL